MSDAVLLLASRDYINHRAVLTVLSTVPLGTTLQVTSSRIGVGHALLRSETLTLTIAPIRWQPTRPDCLPTAQRALIFWDETADAAILRSLTVLKRHRIPLTIYDNDGNTLDLPTLCARLTHNGRNAHTHTMTTRPSVIVDAPPIAPGESQPRKDTKVRLQLHVPEATVAEYELQARAAGISLEKACADRLRTCVLHTSGRGLYFTDAERSELERITGGHMLPDAQTALNRVRTTVTLRVGDITIEIGERVLARCASRAKSVRKSLEEYVRQEVVQGLERATGLRPY